MLQFGRAVTVDHGNMYLNASDRDVAHNGHWEIISLLYHDIQTIQGTIYSYMSSVRKIGR